MRKHTLLRFMFRFYPKQYREQYEHDTLQTLNDMLDDEPSKLKHVHIELHELLATPGYIVKQVDKSTFGVSRIMMSFALLIVYVLVTTIHEIVEENYHVYTFTSLSAGIPYIAVGSMLVALYSGVYLPLSVNKTHMKRWHKVLAVLSASIYIAIIGIVLLHSFGLVRWNH